LISAWKNDTYRFRVSLILIVAGGFNDRPCFLLPVRYCLLPTPSYSRMIIA
jgi:hypothetical protein